MKLMKIIKEEHINRSKMQKIHNTITACISDEFDVLSHQEQLFLLDGLIGYLNGLKKRAEYAVGNEG